MKKLALKAEKRQEKTKARNLRHQGQIPAVIYNHGNTEQIQVEKSTISRIFAHGVSESTLIDVDLGGETNTAFIKDFQVHPVTEEILHIDFYRITEGEKIKTNVAIHLEGKPKGVKEGGVLEVFLHDVEIETFPRFLVPSFDVDISHLAIGDSVHIEDIQLPEETKLMVSGNPIICQVSSSAKLEASLDEEAAAEGEGAGEGAEDEGEEGSSEEE